jgi:hypothetical protein
MSTLDDLTAHALRAARPHEMRSRLFVSYGLMLLGLFALLTLARAHWFTLDKYWESLVDKLSAGVVLAGITLLWYWLIAPRASFNENLEVVEAWNIQTKLNALKDTKSYWFRGRSARWFRAKAIPSLSDAARHDQTAREVNLILPDPLNTEVLQAYASHRNSLPSAETDLWTSNRLRNEILATLLVAGKAAADNSRLKIRVFLVPDFSVVRYDLSDAGLVMTREDKRWPGWFSGSHSRFYASIKEDLRIISERGQEIDLAKPKWPAKKLVLEDLSALLKQLGFSLSLDPSEIGAIFAAVQLDQSPYA